MKYIKTYKFNISTYLALNNRVLDKKICICQQIVKLPKCFGDLS